MVQCARSCERGCIEYVTPLHSPFTACRSRQWDVSYIIINHGFRCTAQNIQPETEVTKSRAVYLRNSP